MGIFELKVILNSFGVKCEEIIDDFYELCNLYEMLGIVDFCLNLFVTSYGSNFDMK